jgi:hypothetical protein
MASYRRWGAVLPNDPGADTVELVIEVMGLWYGDPQEQLVREYLARLADNGVTDYSFDEAWRHYRFAVAYLMLLPVITLVGWDTMPERPRALCLRLTERAAAAIDDLDATEVFE